MPWPTDTPTPFTVSTGAPLWNRPLGLAAPFVPQPVPGDATVVAIDARHNELVRLDASTGALKWRLGLGAAAADPPLVVGNQLAQVIPSGKLLLVGLESGELESTVNLGRPLARSPVNDEAGQHLYILGRQDTLFVLAREPLSCIAVVYLGHADASMPCAPARLGRYLIVPENNSMYNSQLHVMLLDPEGAKVKAVQDVDVSGWPWETPANAGPIVWGLGDKGGYEAFSVGDYTSKTPFKSLAKLTADSVSSGPAFGLARSDRELWVASAHSGRFDLDLEKGTIDAHTPIAAAGPGAGTDPEGGKAGGHDVHGSRQRRSCALGGRHRYDRRRLEDDCRRALAGQALTGGERLAFPDRPRRQGGRARRRTDHEGWLPGRGGSQAG